MSDVFVVTSTWCGSCKVLKTQLTEKNIPFTEADIDSDLGMKLVQQFGIKSLPTTVINNKAIVGLKLQEILGELNE